MLRCFHFCLAAGSSIDETTKNVTLFNLVEQIHLVEAQLGTTVGIEVHAYFFVAEAGRHANFEMRVIRIAADGAEDAGSALPFQTREGERMRVRVQMFRLPPAYGTYELRLEWRPRGAEEWRPEPHRWPLMLVDPAVTLAALRASLPPEEVEQLAP